MTEARSSLPASDGSRLLLVDASNSIYRAFLALPPLRSPQGAPTHAALGFLNMLAKALREEAPDHVAVVLDAPGPSFRRERYAGYKASRDNQPEDLSAQLPLVRELVAALRIPLLEIGGRIRWVVGFRTDHETRVDAGARRVARVQVEAL